MGTFIAPFANGVSRFHIMGGFGSPLGDVVNMFTQNAAVANSAGTTAAIPMLTTAAAGTLVIPASYAIIGTSFHIKAVGYISSFSTGPTLQLIVTLGGTTIYSSNTPTLANSLTTVPIDLDIYGSFVTVGAAGSLVCDGGMNIIGQPPVWQSAVKSTAGFNTTVSNTFALTSTFGTGNVANILTLTQAGIDIWG